MKTGVLLRLQRDLQQNRTVVAAEDIGKDPGFTDLAPQTVGNKKIVDAPSRVGVSGVEPIAPPGIGVLLVWIEEAEGVDKTRLQKFVEFPAFFIRKACVAPVCGGMLQVDLVVRHVHVAADDHRFFCVKRKEIGPECVLPCHAVVDPGQTLLCVGRIDRYQIKGGIFTGDDPSLGVMGGDTDSVFDG